MSALNTCLRFLTQTVHYLRLSRTPEASIPELQKAWALETLRRFKIDLDVSGLVSDQKPLILVGNHISYLDIALLMSAVDEVSFVAKKELSTWPVIGRAAQAMKTIFVSRDSKSSRGEAREAIRQGLMENRRIVVFPSGTTSLMESRQWRRGVFEIAKELDIPVQPFRLTYTPLRRSAFIDRDLFPTHLYHLAQLPRISARLEFHPLVMIKDPTREACLWQAWSKEILGSTDTVESATLRSSSINFITT